MTAAIATTPPFALTRAAGPAPSLPFGPDRPDAAPLTERHRPRTLADLYGQGAAVNQLLGFVEAPHSAAFIFEGPTGVGKTSAALALANELGVHRRADFFHIRSGRQDGATVEDVLDVFRFPPWTPGGWRLVLVDECDLWTPSQSNVPIGKRRCHWRPDGLRRQSMSRTHSATTVRSESISWVKYVARLLGVLARCTPALRVTSELGRRAL